MAKNLGLLSWFDIWQNKELKNKITLGIVKNHLKIKNMLFEKSTQKKVLQA